MSHDEMMSIQCRPTAVIYLPKTSRSPFVVLQGDPGGSSAAFTSRAEINWRLNKNINLGKSSKIIPKIILVKRMAEETDVGEVKIGRAHV